MTTPTFTGEVQFRRWSDSSTQGVQVTFALHDSEALEPLKHKAGKRFMAVLVEIGDDEQPVEPMPAKPRKDTRGPLCREACDLCDLPEFQRWVGLITNDYAAGAVQARLWILRVCDVDSRKDLDTDRKAGQVFISNIRMGFMRWQREQRKAA